MTVTFLLARCWLPPWAAGVHYSSSSSMQPRNKNIWSRDGWVCSPCYGCASSPPSRACAALCCSFSGRGSACAHQSEPSAIPVGVQNLRLPYWTNTQVVDSGCAVWHDAQIGYAHVGTRYHAEGAPSGTPCQSSRRCYVPFLFATFLGAHGRRKSSVSCPVACYPLISLTFWGIQPFRPTGLRWPAASHRQGSVYSGRIS